MYFSHMFGSCTEPPFLTCSLVPGFRSLLCYLLTLCLRFTDLKNGDYSTNFIELLWRLNDVITVKCLEQCLEHKHFIHVTVVTLPIHHVTLHAAWWEPAGATALRTRSA